MINEIVADQKGEHAVGIITRFSKALAGLKAAKDPEQIHRAEAEINSIQVLMRDGGLFKIEEIRPVNEALMFGRWKLGRALAAVEREKARPGKTALSGLTPLLERLHLTRPTAMAAQRIGTLPEDELEKIFAEYRKLVDVLLHYEILLERARPYWYAASRKAKHEKIREGAEESEAPLGPFPLIYADPPWKFEVYSEKGLERTPDQHYETLTYEEIADFKIGDLTIPEIAFDDAALFLWCTSSNVEKALGIMDAWDFTYKTHAVWDKDKGGLGLVFRNWHEVLLYGTRGKMPGPQYQPPSVFRYPRGKHSAKPPEIRVEIEKMYPDFDATTRLELFARETVRGWTPYGLESLGKAAE